KAEEEARRKAEEEARRKAEEEARKEAEAEAERIRIAEEKARKEAEAEAERIRIAEEKARKEAEAEAERIRIAEEKARKKAEAEAERIRIAEEKARRKAEEEARKKAEKEARIQAERLARIKAALEEKRRREEEARRNQEAAMSSGLMAAFGDEDEDLADFLDEPDTDLVGGEDGTLLGAPPTGAPPAETLVPVPEGGSPGGVDDVAIGISDVTLSEIEDLLADIEDLENIDLILGDGVAGEAASRDEILAFLEDVAAGRVEVGELVARATTVVDSPFKIIGESTGRVIRKEADIARIIHSHRVEITRFFDRALVRIPGLRGEVNVKMVIAADGHVSTAEVLDSTTGAPSFDKALIRRILKWEFPPVPVGEVSGTYLFRFSERL
ncbi:MAG: TonB family protein, partial [Leptospirillia bacterium]